MRPFFRRAGSRTAVLALTALALAACGTTVSTTTLSSQGGAAGLGLNGQPSTTGGTSGSSATGSADGSTPGRTGGLAADGPAPSGVGSTTTPAGGPAGSSGGTTPTRTTSIPATGRGWDKTFVYIGVTTQKDVQGAFATVGFSALDAGDQEGQANAMAAELNRHGGIFGRQVKIIFKDEATVATKQDPDTAGAAACTYFTQDHPVIALLSPVSLMDVPSFRSCMAKAKVPLFSASVAAVDKKVSESLSPYFYQLVAPTWDALAPTLLSRLKAQGWFGGWDTRNGKPGSSPVKVGLFVPDTADGRNVEAVLKSDLASIGYKNTVAFEFSTTSDNSSSAVLSFKGNGVTHVIAADPSLQPFQTQASNQGYKPRYGITSYNAPQAFLEGNSPKGQNTGAVGVGWSPSFDVSDGNDNVTTPAEKDCLAIMAKGGQTFTGKRLAEAVAFAFCDGIRLIGQSAAAGGGFVGTSVYQGVLKVAPRFQPAFSFANGLAGSRLFVPGAVRDLVWVTSCTCFRYAGPMTRM